MKAILSIILLSLCENRLLANLKAWKKSQYASDVTIYFVIFGKVTFDEFVNDLEMYCKGEISHTFT